MEEVYAHGRVVRQVGRQETSGLGACAPAPRVAGKPPLRSFRFPTPCSTGLLIMPLATHVGEDPCPLHLAAELSEGLLQVLPFSDLNLQSLLTSFKLNGRCPQWTTHCVPFVTQQYKIKRRGESTGTPTQLPMPGNSLASRFRSCWANGTG